MITDTEQRFMIEILTNRKIFEYDVHSLVKAFYPKEDVSVSFSPDIPEGFSGYVITYADDRLLNTTSGQLLNISFYQNGRSEIT